MENYMETECEAPLWKSRRYTSSSPLCTWLPGLDLLGFHGMSRRLLFIIFVFRALCLGVGTGCGSGCGIPDKISQ